MILSHVLRSMMFLAAVGIVSVLASPIQLRVREQRKEVAGTGLSEIVAHAQQPRPGDSFQEPALSNPNPPTSPTSHVQLQAPIPQNAEIVAVDAKFDFVPAAMRLIAKQNMQFEQWISLCSRYVFLDPIWKNVLFYVERKPVDKYPDPFPLSTKMDHIRRSQFYARNSHLHNLLNYLYNELSRPNRTPSGGAGSNDEQLMLFNAYFILATARVQVDAQIARIKLYGGYIRYKPWFDQIFSRIKNEKFLDPMDMINLHLGDILDNGYESRLSIPPPQALTSDFSAYFLSGVYEAYRLEVPPGLGALLYPVGSH
ncbi:hypothetical protein EV361DRAFT_950185 [Lentinula raphanica]|uniref:Secreted protein n=1 Tax=Lentinula raphanica TaxID=153919 RepID=A0AA38UFL3_9AGAR|nr:hypothetical protein F5878DRAFT_659793 [Lentinula raphanica]KAJ3970892.1 hypothetical protein EV361DRAFT_950185 [Lentinula raphanica]